MNTPPKAAGTLTHHDAGRSVTVYDPDKGLKTIAVADGIEKHLKRVWHQTKDLFAREQLEKAIDTKIDEQADYSVWRAAAVPSASQRGKRGGRHNKKLIAAPQLALPAADPGVDVAFRWRERFCAKIGDTIQRDEIKIADAKEDAKHRCVRVCEQENANTVRGTAGTGEIERYTPAKYIEAARQVLGEIDLDPASCDLAQQTVQATEYFTLENSGLKQDWHARIWLNPPYHRDLLPLFINKLVEQLTAGHISAAIMLTNNGTDTEWFDDAFNACTGICFTHGRIIFTNEKGKEINDPTQGHAFFYFGHDVQRFEDVFCNIGRCVRRSRNYVRKPRGAR